MSINTKKPPAKTGGFFVDTNRKGKLYLKTGDVMFGGPARTVRPEPADPVFRPAAGEHQKEVVDAGSL